MTDQPATLLSIKRRLSAIADLIYPNQRIIYVDYPLHPNIGDLLINQGTEEFFLAHGLRVRQRFSYHDFPRKIAGVDDRDVFMFHGGGNFGDLYPEHLNLLLTILRDYPDNRIIVLPQTVFFGDRREQERVCGELLRHKDLTLFVRDDQSFAALAAFTELNVSLMPDMAHQLTGQLKADPRVTGKERLYFLRRDEEAGHRPQGIDCDPRESVDWADCITLRDRIAFAFLFRAVHYSRAARIPLHLHRPWYRLRNSMVESGVKFISQSQVIYTDRLHAALLGLLLGREVVAFDNSYGKLSTYCRTWLRDIPNLRFVTR